MNEQLLLKPADAAKKLAISLSYLRELKAAGAIPFVPIGGAVRYDIADLRAYVEAKKMTNRICAPA
jgi:excisionase family DNA binding protein